MPRELPHASYWSQRYQEGQTGWDLGRVATPLKAYADQLTDPSLRILVPGAGNGYEVEYLYRRGFRQVEILDIARPPLEAFRRRMPDFPASQIVEADFFDHQGTYDLILEQTFFCAFEPTPSRRQAYAEQVRRLLRPGGRLVGLWWSFPLRPGQDSPPFGGSQAEYLSYFAEGFSTHTFAPCTNSVPERAGKEYFGIFIRQ